jgi:hypothetical protein
MREARVTSPPCLASPKSLPAPGVREVVDGTQPLGKAVRIHTKVHAPLAVQWAAPKRLLFRIGLGEECSPSIPLMEGRAGRLKLHAIAIS